MTDSKPLITFALFAYNHEAYIREAIAHAFAQTYEPLEIILSDDCSQDATYHIMQEMAEAYDGPHRVTLHQTKSNLGGQRLGLRFWEVLKDVRGELIVLAAGDDLSAPERCEALYECWHRSGKGVCAMHSLVNVIDEQGHVLISRHGDNAIQARTIAEVIETEGRGLLGAALAISRRLIDDFDKLPDRLWFEDGALAFRGKLKDGILWVNEPLVSYRRHRTNISGSTEIINPNAFNRHMLGLMGLHASFMCDYMQHADKADPGVMVSFARQIKRLHRRSKLFHGTLCQRLIAVLVYAREDSLKRKLWLLWHYGLRRKI